MPLCEKRLGEPVSPRAVTTGRVNHHTDVVLTGRTCDEIAERDGELVHRVADGGRFRICGDATRGRGAVPSMQDGSLRQSLSSRV